MGGGAATHKCYNGYNYYVLGWHGDQTNEVHLRPGAAKLYHLVGIGDVQSGHVVNIKAADFFITFNLKTGINWEIDDEGVDEDYTNEILIHQGLDVPFRQTLAVSYFDTSLVGNLTHVEDMFVAHTMQGDLKIKLCSIDRIGSEGAILSIGLDYVSCDLPTGKVSNPVGMRTLTSGVPLFGLSGYRDEVLEFRLDVPDDAQMAHCSSWGGNGDVDLFMNFRSSPQISFTDGVNTVSKRTRSR